MSKMITVIIGAIVLFAAAIGGTLAFTGGGNSNSNMHTMQNGQTMTGQTTNGTHTMTDGNNTMSGMSMP